MPEGLGNMLKTAQVAAKIQSRCEKYGWSYEVKRGSILTISKAFTPNDTDALVECDMEYYSILSELPMCRDGSDWGTDCSGVGASDTNSYSDILKNNYEKTATFFN